MMRRIECQVRCVKKSWVILSVNSIIPVRQEPNDRHGWHNPNIRMSLGSLSTPDYDMRRRWKNSSKPCRGASRTSGTKAAT